MSDISFVTQNIRNPATADVNKVGYCSEVKFASNNAVALQDEYFGCSQDIISMGTEFNPRHLNVIYRNELEKAMKDSGARTTQFVHLSDPLINDLVKTVLTGAPTIYDPYDKQSVIESEEKAMEALGKAIGASHFESVDNRLSKAISTSSPFIHAVADGDVGILIYKPYPFQALINQEAVRGTTCIWDVIGPYDLASAYFGTEDPQLIESDFPQHTRQDTIKFMYSTGRVLDATYRAGLSAYPSRDFLTLSTITHQEAMRSLRERSDLGITKNVLSPYNDYMPAGPLEYEGIYQKIMRSTGQYQCWVNGANLISPTDTLAQQYEKIEAALVDSAIKMQVMNITPNLMMCDPKTFKIIRAGLMKTQYGVPPQEAYRFGISSIRISLPSIGELELVNHSMLPMADGQRAIYLLDTRLLAQRIAWRDMMEVLGKTNPSQKFYISAAETFIDKSDIDGQSCLMGGVFNL